MNIALEKKQNNIAEYVLYMWQVEDLLRAFNLDIDLLEKNVFGIFSEDDKERASIKEWYSKILEMMQLERIVKQGHLQITTNIILDLNTLHVELLKNPAENKYKELYYKAASNLREFEQKITDKETNEVEMMFIGLYGLLMMRIKKETVSKETEAAMKTFSDLLAVLATKYHKRETDEKTVLLS